MMNVSTNLISQRLNSLNSATADNQQNKQVQTSIESSVSSQNLLSKFLKSISTD